MSSTTFEREDDDRRPRGNLPLKRIATVGLILVLVVAGRYGYVALERANIARAERAADAKVARLKQALDATISLTEFSGTHPLDQVVRELAKASGVPIELDTAALLAEGISPQSPVMVPDRQVPLRAAVRLVAQAAELWSVERAGTIHFTSPAAGESALETRYYPLPSLPGGTIASDDEWAAAIRTSSARHSWADVGGPGTLEVLPGAVLITNTAAIHEQLADFFAQIRHPRRASAAAPFILPADPADEQAQAALLKPASVFFNEMPLDEVAKFLSDHYDVPVLLDRRKLQEAAVEPNVPITCTLRDVSLRNILTIMLDELQLTFTILDGVVKITTPEDAERQSITIVYDVRELALEPYGFADFDPLINTITNVVAPQTWDEVGGPGSLNTLGYSLLIFSQLPEVHLQVADFLAALTAAKNAAPGGQPLPIFVRSYASPAEDKLRAALAREMRLDYGAIRIDHLCETLSKATGVNVRPSIDRLEEVGVTTDALVHCQLPAMPLAEGLEAVLAPLDMAAVIRRETLEITSREAAESVQETRLYDVRSFAPALASLDAATSPGEFVDFLKRAADPSVWIYQGGPADVTAFHDLLVVTCDAQTHRRLARVLAILAAIERSPEPGNPDEPPQWLTLTKVEQDLVKRLNKPIVLKLQASTLRAALDEIARGLGCRWQYDVAGETAQQQRALDEPLTCAFQNVPACEVLRQLLLPTWLSFDLTRNQLEIVGLPQSRRQVRLYPIADLVDDALAADNLADDLPDALPAELAADQAVAWRNTHLAVSAPISDHPAIEAYLRDLRKPPSLGRAK